MANQFFKRKKKELEAKTKALIEDKTEKEAQIANKRDMEAAAVKAAEDLLAAEIAKEVAKQEAEASAPPEVIVNDFTGFDIFFDKSDRKHKAVVLEYNPDTNEVKIESIVPVSRQVALAYLQQKLALTTILKRKNRKV